MSNLKTKLSQDGNTLILEIDISEKAKASAVPSSTGKTLVVASTNGFQNHAGINVSLNATVRNPAYVASKA